MSFNVYILPTITIIYQNLSKQRNINIYLIILVDIILTLSDEYDTLKEVVYGKKRIEYYSKEFKQLSKWSKNIYNTAVVIDYFVANQPEIEECYNLAPVIKHLRNDADVLNAFFIDHKKDVEI